MFEQKKYVLNRKIMQFIGAVFEIKDESDNLVAYVKQQAFKLREEIKVYSDKDQSNELFVIKARNVLDFSANYDIIDSKTTNRIGVLQRKGFKSIARDEWIVKNSQDEEIGILQEDSMGMAMIRRLLLNLIPQNYDLNINNKRVSDLRQIFTFFGYKLSIDLSENTEGKLDPRVAIAAAILLAAVEGKQS